MPKLTDNRFPSYRHHRRSGQAVVTLSGKDFYLGPYGSRASHAAYDKVITEWLANGRRLPESPTDARLDMTITELIAAYWGHAETYYSKNGVPTSEQSLIKLAMRPLRQLYGSDSASDFGPLALKAVRKKMVDQSICRTSINAFVDRIKRMFRWAVENELVSPEVYHGLQAVSGLRRGRCEARESVPVKPVPDAFVDAIRSRVSRQVC